MKVYIIIRSSIRVQAIVLPFTLSGDNGYDEV